MSVLIKAIGFYATIASGIVGISLLTGRGCNNFFNNREVNRQSYSMVSYATGISGHVEYIRFLDGSQDVKIYPDWGHRLFDSELDQDLNGDGKVDRIRRNGSEWKLHRLDEMLIRETDYKTNKERFDHADGILQDLMKKYPK